MISKQQNCNATFDSNPFLDDNDDVIAKQNLVWTLYEIDFVVLIISKKLKLFTWLSGASPLGKGNNARRDD